LHYLVGAGWSAAGEFTTEKAWTDYVAACAARERSPITVTVSAAP
jgi:pectinesterase